MTVLKFFVAFVVTVFGVMNRSHAMRTEQTSDFMGKIFPTDRLDGNQVFGEVVACQGDLLFVSGRMKGGKSRVLVYREPSNDTHSFHHLGDLVRDKDSDGSSFGASIAASKSFVAVGAPLDSAAGFESGKVFLYDSDAIAFLGSTANSNTSQSLPPLPPPRPIVLQSGVEGSSAFRERFGSSLSVSDDVIVVGAPASSFGSAYIFRRDSSLQFKWKLVGRLRSPFAASPSSLPSDRFGEKVQVVMISTASKGSSGVTVVVGSPGFSSSSDSVNSGAVFLYSCSALFSNKPVHTLIDTIYAPDNKEVTSSHSFFGHNFYFTADVAFIAAFTPALAGVVHYYERDHVTSSFVRKEMLTSFPSRRTSFSPSFTPSTYLDGFGTSLLSIQATIKVTRKHLTVNHNHSLNTSYSSHRHSLRHLEAEDDEDEDEDSVPSAPPSSPPTTRPNSTFPSSSPTSSEHVIHLLLVGAPSTSLLPRRGGSGKVEEGGVVYVFSNHRHVIRNLTCTSSTSPEREAYFHSLCANASSGDWEMVEIFSADDISQLPHAHYGRQIAAALRQASLLISAPFVPPPSSSGGSGVVYVTDRLRQTLSQLGDDVSKLLNGESSDSGSEAPSSGGSGGGDVFSGLWRALTSTDGVIVTATCLPALLIAALALYLYFRPPLVGGAVYSKMMSPNPSTISSKTVNRQSEDDGERIQQVSYYHHLVHSLTGARAKTLHHISESNEEGSTAPLSWRMWWRGKYDELTTTASDVIASAIPDDPTTLSPPRSLSSSHSTSVKEEEVEEQIYDSSFPAADVTSAKEKKKSGRATKWTSNPLHIDRDVSHSRGEGERAAADLPTTSFSSMTQFLGQWVPTLSTAIDRKEVDDDASRLR